MSKTVSIKLPLERITKGAVRYGREVTDARDTAGLTNQIYFRQDALRAYYPDGKWPAKVTINVELP